MALRIQVGGEHCQGDFSFNFLYLLSDKLKSISTDETDTVCIIRAGQLVEEYPGLKTSMF